MLSDEEDQMVVGAIIDLSENFHRRVVAEGIEDADTRDRLLEMGCHVAQGYFWARPMPADEAMAWAKRFTREK